MAQQIVAKGMLPKHAQLRAILVDMCTNQLSPGDALPSERQLCLDHGVSRVTVREALGQLVAEGLAVRVHGRGTFVAERAYRSELRLASFHEDMRRLGLEPGTVVLSIGQDTPSPASTTALQMSEKQKAWHVRRLRLADGTPISIDDAWYSADLLPDLDRVDFTISIYETLATRFGYPIDRAEQTVGAGPASSETAALLGIHKDASVMTFDRIAYSGGQPIEHAYSWFRADRYQLHMTLTDR
ncbi:GntR family transcriptional regulator [Streptomyces sp. SLBN-118]|uniref:GntR family transcriptional regulator n=1 Tax=Streptomyces sp. SLBN-118 TaxID=2768454 RepID=UPI001167202C|nr:GntR family transcriptional regulator [Streptomyces sp. SLBN-118]TQK42427.1 GntR family transcriptional regulator [Streptomyces sp. SLBN-118]